MANALIDNSEQFKLVKYVKELVSRPDCNHIMIATGYWDLPGTSLVYEELKGFFARGGKLDSLFNAMERRFKEARAISQDTDDGKIQARSIVKEISEKIRNCVLNTLSSNGNPRK